MRYGLTLLATLLTLPVYAADAVVIEHPTHAQPADMAKPHPVTEEPTVITYDAYGRVIQKNKKVEKPAAVEPPAANPVSTMRSDRSGMRSDRDLIKK